MKAVFIDRFGGPEVLTYGDLPDPVAGPGQVVVDVAAASVNGADWRVRAGQYAEAKFPLVLGRDFSGTVSAAARRRHDLESRRRRLRRARSRPRGRLCREARDHRGDHRQKARRAFTTSTRPRWRSPALPQIISIETTLKLQRGETILIQGGAGGVASFAIQLAKHIGARVITTIKRRQSSTMSAASAPTRSSTTARRILPARSAAATRCSIRSAAMWR